MLAYSRQDDFRDIIMVVKVLKQLLRAKGGNRFQQVRLSQVMYGLTQREDIQNL